jgi:hypothetical protein
MSTWEKMGKRSWLWLVVVFFLLSGCSAQPVVEQPTIDNEIVLDAANSVGQTFVARFDGLSGIYFTLSPGEPGDGEIRLHLRADSQASEDLAVSNRAIPIQAITGPTLEGFFVPPQTDSNQKYYYAFLEVVGNGSVEVSSGPGESYLDGALYQNHQPLDAQAAFQLSYSRRSVALGLTKEMLGWVGVVLVSLFLFCLPGWGILSVLLPQWDKLTWVEKLGLSAGLSIAIYPILLLWTYLIGLSLGAAYAWIPPLIGGYLLVWRRREDMRFAWQRLTTLRWYDLQAKISDIQFSWPDLALLILLAMIIFTRFWAIRSLEAPMWGDGYQHTVIAQLLVDNNGLFNSWQPYAALTTFTYHFGFHNAVAVFHWLSGIDVIHATLWVGQIMNVLAVLVLYPLALKVSGGNRWAGVVAVLVAGLLSPMPMFYVNWGRYTQLAGQVILPVAVWLAWEGLDGQKVTWQNLFLGWLAWGGLALTHYRVLIMGVLFFVIYGVLFVRRNNIQHALKTTLLMGVGAGTLFLPWIISVYSGKIMHFFTMFVTRPAIEINTAITDPLNPLPTYLPISIWLLLIVVAGWLLWQRQKPAAMIMLWGAGVYLAANPQWIGLPGNGSLGNHTVLIAIYIPASILIGTAICWPIKALDVGYMRKIASGVMAGLVVFIGLHGVTERQKEIEPDIHVLLTRPDLHAATWLQENTSTKTRLLVNSFFAFGNSSIVGSDGGWWLPIVARRQTSLPPLNYAFEQGDQGDYVSWINTLTAEIETKGLANTDVLTMLQNRGITHIFLGQRQGIVNSRGALLPAVTLKTNVTLIPIYHQDRVWIFEIRNRNGNE